MTDQSLFMGTGRRKTAVARVFLRPGSGKVIVNGRRFEEYFPGEGMRLAVRQPLVSTENRDSFDLKVNVLGGGIYGQSIAVRLGVARALLVYNPDLRPTLRRAGFLTRDPRAKERKKYGQKGARKRFQYSKR